MGLEPDIGQELSQPVPRLGRESAEDVLEVGEGIDVVVLTGAGEGVQDGRRPAATITPNEFIIIELYNMCTRHHLGEVIINAQLPVFRVATQRRPVRLSVGDRLTDRALGHREAALLAQSLPEYRQQRALGDKTVGLARFPYGLLARIIL